MRIKRFRGKSFSEALAMVRRELGADALILSSDERKDAGLYVEVTAAIDYEPEAREDTVQNAADNVASGGFEELKREISSMKRYLETLRNSGFQLSLPEAKRDVYFFLKERSIDEEYALGIVERAGTVREAVEVMTDDMQLFMEQDSGNGSSGEKGIDSRTVMLIGPTGSGKTTTVAKLASKAIREGKRVALISLDTLKIGAAEQIRVYARMIGIPLDIVSDSEGFLKSVRKFADRDLILVDTAGHNPCDEEGLRRLRSIYETGLPVDTHLLLSTSSDNRFLMNTYSYYKSLPVNRLAFTKTDEAVRLGAIYNLSRLYRLPAEYITTGQGVPGNIEFIDSRELANLIINTGSA
jgi:flagellar biosynthesis protein FlhF